MIEKIKDIIRKILDSLPSPQPAMAPARARKAKTGSGR
jgi:hypothetical protein